MQFAWHPEKHLLESKQSKQRKTKANPELQLLGRHIASSGIHLVLEKCVPEPHHQSLSKADPALVPEAAILSQWGAPPRFIYLRP